MFRALVATSLSFFVLFGQSTAVQLRELPEWVGCESKNLQDSSMSYVTYWYFDGSGKYSGRHSTLVNGKGFEYPQTVRFFGRWAYEGEELRTTEHSHQNEGAKGRQLYTLIADYSRL